MPILFVNGKRRGLRVRGRARVGGKPKARRNPSWPVTSRKDIRAPGRRVVATVSRTARGHRVTALHKATRQGVRDLSQPWSSTTGWRRARRNPPKGARKGKNGRWVSAKSIAALAAYNRKRRGKARRSRSSTMAKSSKRSRAMKRRWRARKAAGMSGRIGRTKRRRSPKRRRTRARRGRARRTKRRRSSKRRARRTRRARRARQTTRRTRRRRRARMGTKTYRRRVRSARSLMSSHDAATVRVAGLQGNPGRRRRRRRRTSRRRHRRTTHRRRRTRRTRSRRSYRRYSRRYRRNPGIGDLVSMAKAALPVLAGFYGSRLIVGTVGPMLPMVSALGSLQGPVLSIATLLGGDWLAKRFAPAHRTSLMMGAAVQALDSVVRTFAPASVKTMIGMSDYVAVGDYISVGATPLRENFTLSDYVAVGGDGVEQELGLEEELGVEEELGNAADGYMGGLPGGARLLAPVPSQSFVSPIPARSFTKSIPAAGTAYDTANDVYTGIFNGRFGS